jgi:hypothetical protein
LNKYHIGRTRIRAANLIDKHFPDWKCQPEDISPATGAWRTNWRLDVYRWELYASKASDANFPVVLGCWQTLTDFVRFGRKNGIKVDLKNLEISANEK